MRLTHALTAAGAMMAVLLGAGPAAPGKSPAADAPAAETPANEDAFEGEVHLVLYEALFQGEVPGPIRANLVLSVEADDGVWGKVFGMALNYNQGDHFGYVEDSAVEPDRLRLEIGMRIGRDNWVSGGPGQYTVTLERGPDGSLEGTYEGTFKEQPVSGRASGEVRPPRPIRVEDCRPLDPTEHPRLLFREADLPALRAKLETPLGKAYLEKAKSATKCPLTQGMLYQLTGDETYAGRAMEIIRGYGPAIDPGPQGRGSGGVGHQFVAVSIAYDLCHDAWPAAFRKDLADRMLNIVQYAQRTLDISFANFHPCSNYYGPGRGSPAIASLALYGDKGPLPEKPVSPDELIAGGGFRAKLLARSGELDKYRQAYARMLAQWKADRQAWEQSGGADLAKLGVFFAGLAHMRRHYRVGIGDGGFQAETGGYADIGSWYPLVYATCYQNMFGRSPSSYPDVTHLMVRRVMQVIFQEDGGMRVQKINSACGVRPRWCAAAYPVVPKEYRRSLLWAWNHAAGVEGEEDLGNLIEDFRGFGLPQALALVNYPLDVEPQHPSEAMPLTWQAPTLGFYLFRDGWQGRDDFVGQVFLKAHPVGGWNHPNAGAFTLLGLGHTWAATAEGRNGVREQESVVLLPEDRINQGSCGLLAHLETRDDGSGSLTIDYRDLYGGRKTVQVKPEERVQTKGGGIVIDRTPGQGGLVTRTLRVWDSQGVRNPDHWAPSGIDGLRAVAFDYSGASGAPGLMVLVDRVTGGKKKVWTWQIPREGRRGDSVPTVEVDGRSFTMSYPDASLRGTFVSPADVKVEVASDYIEVGTPRHGFHGTVNRIKATGADPTAGDFFVVITVQRTDPPEVKVAGEGLGATATVGRQTVRFEEGPPARIVLGAGWAPRARSGSSG